ncbi:CIA30 family protein [Marinobacteraceae bacterium S3BR75-40.1]
MKLLSHPSLVQHQDNGSSLPGDRENQRLSQSEIREHDGIECFLGNILYRRGCGQPVVQLDLGEIDYTAANGIELLVKGDGRRYALCVQTLAPGGRHSFRIDFRPVSGFWQPLQLPFLDFKLADQGRGTAPVNLNPAYLHRQAMLMADPQPGRFQLEIDGIAAFRQAGYRQAAHITRHLVAS